MDVPLNCIICRRYSGSGISILGKFICHECEKKLVDTEIEDDRYDEYKNLIKRNIYGDFFISSH